MVNPLDVPVLLYEGEEVLGAQQNRTFDVSALVGAGSALRVPVSCVEARPLGRRAPQRGVHARAAGRLPGAAAGEERAGARERGRRRRGAGAPGRGLGRGRRPRRRGTAWRSPTDALHDVYEGRRDELGALAGDVPCLDAQVGALAAIGGRFVVLDHVSEPAAWAALHGPIVQGYALDALETRPAARRADGARTRGTSSTCCCGRRCRPARRSGWARACASTSAASRGTGVAVEGELVALTAFAGGGYGVVVDSVKVSVLL